MSSTKFVFFGLIGKQDARPGLWLAETFSTSSLKPLNGIQGNLTRSKISMSSTKFVFFGPIGKTRWPPWPLIGWDIFDFSSQTAERNSTKLDRKQDLNILYQVCVFGADRKNKMAALASDWLRHFRLLLWNRWTEFNETWQQARSQRLLPSLCFSCRWVNKNFRSGWSVKKVAHCTQVHDMWPFGPLVSINFPRRGRSPVPAGGGNPPSHRAPPPPCGASSRFRPQAVHGPSGSATSFIIHTSCNTLSTTTHFWPHDHHWAHAVDRRVCSPFQNWFHWFKELKHKPLGHDLH